MVHQRLALFSFSPFSFFLTSPAGKEPLFDHIRRERERSVVLLTLPLAFDSLLIGLPGVGRCRISPFLLCTPDVSQPANVKLCA